MDFNLRIKGNSTKYVYILGAVLGALAFVRAFPISVLSGYEGFFWGDHAANVSGYYAYRDSPWSIPLLWTNQLNYPDGLNIVSLDSLPLIALLFKPFSSLLPNNFHYFGLWYGLAYLLQGIGGVFLIRQMGLLRIWDGILAAAFALVAPAFTMRAGHVALMTHVFILLSLGFYFRALRLYNLRTPPRFWYFLWMFLVGCAFLTHPYLAAMVILIYWVMLLDLISIRKSARTFFVAASAPILVIIVNYFCFWYTPGNSLMQGDQGFGVYSLNLIGPFVGGRIIHWGSEFLPLLGQQYEGFNYFGLGMMGLILMAVYLQRKSLKKALFTHKFLVLALIFLTMFSLSNLIYAGQVLVVSYPDWITQAFTPVSAFFRASGRFFWPVGYAGLFAALAGVLSREIKWTTWYATAMLIVQIIDVPISNYPSIAYNEYYTRQIYNESTWDRLLRGKEILYLEPVWMCGGGYDEILPLQLMATRNHVLLNTAYAARQSPNCRRKLDEAKNHIWEGTMHVYFNSIPRKQIEKWMGENTDEWCRRYSHGVICIPFPDLEDLEILNGEEFMPFNSTIIGRFLGSEQFGDTGHSYLTSRVAREVKSSPGFLSRSPKLKLRAGKYYFKLNYMASLADEQTLGRIEVFTNELENDIRNGILTVYPIQGSYEEGITMTGNFVLPQDLQSESLEIRVYWNGLGDLTIEKLLIYERNEGE